ncbi:MAG TPA: Gfo/Idh/MocA family oxidoreductase [Oligoflexia bacterium]|nr:Gfo/Idh/MocA family oxidoreductase [Oligoflexia bacterium]
MGAVNSSSDQTQSASKRLRGAIVGFGFISGKGHFPAYQARTDVEIVAVADVCIARLEAAKKSNETIRTYNSIDELLAAEKELDFIDISTPPCDHFEIALKALRAGLHVLCEKPLTASLEQARELLLAARRYRRVVFPCHNYKHAPVVKTVDEIIASGEIGRVHGLTLNTYRTTHAKGVSEWKTDWRRDKKYSGGGIAMDHGSHTFYLTFNWLKSLPTAVTAKMVKISEAWDTEDNFSCVLTFPTGYASAHLSWTAGVRKVIYSIQGSQGAITIDDDDVQVASQKGTRKFSIASHWGDASHVQWFNSMFDQFVDCIRNSDYVNAELKEAYHCIQIIQRAYDSSNQSSLEQQLDTTFEFLNHQ